MKQTGILYIPDMVQAILDNRKGVTRRIVKPQPSIKASEIVPTINWKGKDFAARFPYPNEDIYEVTDLYKCPYGKIGDYLYVREAYYQYGHWEEIPGVKTKGGKQKWKFVPDSKEVLFEAPETYRNSRQGLLNPQEPAYYKRLARFMPKEYARIWLEITNIKCERVGDITADQAISEGILYYTDTSGYRRYKDYLADASGYGHPDHDYPTLGMAVTSFSTLWISINGQASWDNNDWVFAISFKVLSTTGKPDNI